MSLRLLLGYALPTVRAGHRSRDTLGEVVKVVLLVLASPQAPGVGACHQHRSQLPQSSLIWEELQRMRSTKEWNLFNTVCTSTAALQRAALTTYSLPTRCL